MNRFAFKGFCSLLFILSLTASCNKNGKDDKTDRQITSYRIVRADISGAVALTLCDAGTTKAGETETTAEDISGLYKVDKDGNLSYVVFYIEVRKDTAGVETRTAKDMNMEIRPTWVFPFGSRYIMLGGCLPSYNGDMWEDFPQNLAESTDAFVNGRKIWWEGDQMFTTNLLSPGYWYLMRKSDGKLFDVSAAVYYGDENISCTMPTPYPLLAGGFDKLRDYLERPGSLPDELSRRIEIEQSGYVHEISSGLYVSSNLASNSCISRVGDKGDNLQVEELTNRNLSAGRNGFLLDNEGYILTNTSSGIVIVSPDGNMTKFQGKDGDWERIVQIGDKWYKLPSDTAAMRIFHDGTMQRLNESGNINYNWINWRPDDIPKYVNGSRMACLSEIFWNGQNSLISISIDSSTDEISVKKFPDEFPTDKELYGKEGVAYVLSEDARTITAYDITTSSSTSIQTDLSKIPAFSLPTSTYNVDEKMFYVSAYRGQEYLFFRIDATTGKAELISTNNTLKTTVFVPLI